MKTMYLSLVALIFWGHTSLFSTRTKISTLFNPENFHIAIENVKDSLENDLLGPRTLSSVEKERKEKLLKIMEAVQASVERLKKQQSDTHPSKQN